MDWEVLTRGGCNECAVDVVVNLGHCWCVVVVVVVVEFGLFRCRAFH